MSDKKSKLDTTNSIVRIIKDRGESTRYKSWEYCYKFFSKSEQEIKKNLDPACLNLAFYLASWGMYRGSSFLLQKDYLVHKPAVLKILEQKDYFRKIDFSKIKSGNNEKEIAGEIAGLISEIKKSYGVYKNKVSDTLASKIILGTLGCIPAYDQYFISGLKEHLDNNKKKYNGLLTINKKSLSYLFDFYRKNEKQTSGAKDKIKKITKSDEPYPAMKLVDMFFWGIGFEKAKEEAKNKKEMRKQIEFAKNYSEISF